MRKITKFIFTFLIFSVFLHPSNLVSNLNQHSKKFDFSYCKYEGNDDNLGISGLKLEFIQQLHSYFNGDAFVESGTYLGDTSYTASLVFPNVYSIELSKTLYEKACSRFESQSNIHLYQGNSSDLLPEILRELKDKKVVFFLDGHFSKRMTAKGETNTPILMELEAIKQSGITNSVIIVDDIRLFQNSVYSQNDSAIEGYPSLNTVLSLLKDINSEYEFIIIGDTAIAYPSDDSIQVSEVVQSCTKSRLYYESSSDELNQILSYEHVIASATGAELECIHNLYTFFSEGELRYGIRSFSSLWYGLTLLKDNKEKAYELFSKAALNSHSDWQIKAYLTD